MSDNTNHFINNINYNPNNIQYYWNIYVIKNDTCVVINKL